jgi:glucose/arabinose dehydrogenase
MLSPMKYILLPIFGMAVSVAPQALPAQLSANAVVVASGLNAPRGMRFGPDGDLYLAEAGTGGTNSTASICPADQVVPPVGPYTGGMTGRISKFDKSWNRTTVASGFASTMDAMGDLLGAQDVQFMNGTLYALISGGGCSHGNPTLPNGVVQVNTSNGTWRYVADISAFMHANPVEYPNASDFEPDGTSYSMTTVNNALHVVEPNSGELLRVDQFSGLISREIDFSASQGHMVPTSVLYKNGSYLIGNLNLFPIEPHTSRVMTVSNFPAGTGTGVPGLNVPGPYYVVASKAGFATIVGLATGPMNGLLYVLQLAPNTPSGYPQPGFGKVTRINPDGSLTDVVTGLSVPTAMTFGPNGKLYISNFGAAPAGAGQIVVATVQ